MNILALVLQFVLLLLAQQFLFANLGLGNYAAAHVAALFVLLIPFQIQSIPGMLLAFGYGLLWDMLSGTMGVHAFTCLLVFWVRPIWVGVISPQVNLQSEEDADFNPLEQTYGWSLSYVLPLFFFYELIYFIMASFSLDLGVLLKTLASGLYSGTLAWLIVILLTKRSK